MAQKVETGEHPLDVLERVGNIGALKATASLSALAGKPVENSFTRVRIVPIEQVPNLLGDPECVIAGVVFEISGDITGSFEIGRAHV